jgi:hypothetical protein
VVSIEICVVLRVFLVGILALGFLHLNKFLG